MTYTAVASRSETSTMTEARVRAVMQKFAANLSNFVVGGYLKKETATKWIEQLSYLQHQEALGFFEIQVQPPSGDRFGLRYTVKSDGSLQQDSASGGVDIYGLPSGTNVSLYAHLRAGTSQAVYDWLAARGWGFNGRKLEAASSAQRVFSSDGYGLMRETVGTWP